MTIQGCLKALFLVCCFSLIYVIDVTVGITLCTWPFAEACALYRAVKNASSCYMTCIGFPHGAGNGARQVKQSVRVSR